jgi:hypothetical protein
VRAPSPSPVQTWTPPPIRLLNINSDVAFVRESRAGASGFIIRDQDGEVVGVYN